MRGRMKGIDDLSALAATAAPVAAP